MHVFLLVLLVVVVVNAAMVVITVISYAASVLRERYHRQREIGFLEDLWRLEAGRSTEPAQQGSALGSPSSSAQPVDQPGPHVDGPSSEPRRDSPGSGRGRKAAVLGVAAVVALAGTALASPQVLRVLSSVASTVARTFHAAPISTAQAPPSRSGPQSLQQVAPSPPRQGKHRVSPSRDPGALGESTGSQRGAAVDHEESPAAGATAPGPSPSLNPSSPSAIAPSPTMVTATASSSSEIDVSWSDVDSETGYRMERSTDGSSGWTTVATTGQDVTTYSDTGLAAGTTHYYRVYATNAGGDSPPSDVVSLVTSID
jgi:hypothetical protein